MVVKVKHVGPRRRVVTLRIEREFYYELKNRADVLGCSLEDFLDPYIRVLASGYFICSDPHDDRLAEIIRLFRENYPDVYRNIVEMYYADRSDAAPSEEVQDHA